MPVSRLGHPPLTQSLQAVPARRNGLAIDLQLAGVRHERHVLFGRLDPGIWVCDLADQIGLIPRQDCRDRSDVGLRIIRVAPPVAAEEEFRPLARIGRLVRARRWPRGPGGVV